MKVEVYGSHHSPWVQSVLLGLHEKGIEQSLRSLPPLEAFKKWGVLMPVVSIDHGPWEIESSQILVKLGFDPVSDEDLEAVHGAWQGVLHRPDNPLRFFSGFSRAGDRSASCVRRSICNFFRSFVTFYMFTLINFVKLTRKPKDPDDFGFQYLYWEKALENSDGPFIDGNKPGTQDIMLFGVIQCHSSIPVPPLEPLRSDDRLSHLRNWIAAMHERFKDYPYLYSGSYFAPNLPQPVPADYLQRVIFYLGLLSMFLAFPITTSLVFVLMRKVPR
jgi:glutathione S-transferase